MHLSWHLAAAAFVMSVRAAPARGQAPASDRATAPAEAAEPAVTTPPPYTIGGYVEAFYQWNFNRPSNDVTNYRGFDNRHNTFTLANVALDAQWDYRNVLGRVTLQVGHTPSTYYLSEPERAGARGANATGKELWKYLQQAYAGYRVLDVLSLSLGLFLSPIGPESMPIRDNWNWSRSSLFFGLPFYHTGARASYTLSETWAFTLAVYNGWNSVVDNNKQKSLSAQVTFARRTLFVSLLYFSGVERPRGAPEGKPWRHLFDAHATWNATPWLSLLAHANAGFEQSRFGHARWLGGALYARARLVDSLYLAVRGDLFYERVPEGASALFWPVSWVSATTATLEYRVAEHLSCRAEYRHDQSQDAMFFGDRVELDATSSMFVPNRRRQDTLTVGVTAWF